MYLEKSALAITRNVIEDQEKISQTPNKAWAVVELLVSYGLILTANWTSNPVQQWLYWAALLWIGGSTVVWLLRRKSIRLETAGFWRSLWIVGAALLLAALAVTIAAKMHTLQQPYGPMDRVEAFVGYAVWAIAQQWLLQGYFLPRLAPLTPKEAWAAAIVAGLFAVGHLPNMILVVMALVWGLAACLLFLRFRSILSLGIAHAILGITLAISIPGPVLHNMRVGVAFLQYQPPVALSPARSDYRPSAWNGDRRQAQKLQMVKHADRHAEPIEGITQ